MVMYDRIGEDRGKGRVVRDREDREDREKKIVHSPPSRHPLTPLFMHIYAIKMNNYAGRLKNGNEERRGRFPHSPLTPIR